MPFVSVHDDIRLLYRENPLPVIVGQIIIIKKIFFQAFIMYNSSKTLSRGEITKTCIVVLNALDPS